VVPERAHWRQIEAALQEESARRKQSEERLTRLETLVHLSRLISSSHEMTQVLTAICQATATLQAGAFCPMQDEQPPPALGP
jgi:hypothetical protein